MPGAAVPVAAEKVAITAALPVHPPPASGKASSQSADAGQLTVAAGNIALPAQFLPALGSKIDSLSFTGTLRGAISPGRDLRTALAQWRDDGGVLDIKDFHLAWRDVDATGNGTLTLDPSMRPLGAFTMSLAGYDTILDALVASGQLRRQDAGYMKIALDVLARSGDPAHHRLRAPVTVQDGAVYIGPLKIASIPPIPWLRDRG
jgi:hypothetical protein